MHANAARDGKYANDVNALWLRGEQEVHGTGFVPIGYNNPKEPGWIEAARWIQKNAKNFRKGKLSDKKYAMIRDIVGTLFSKSAC